MTVGNFPKRQPISAAFLIALTVTFCAVKPAQAGSIDLYDFAVSVQGGTSGDWQDIGTVNPLAIIDSSSTIVCCGDASGGTTPGLGTVNYTFNPGVAGTYTVTLYFDYDVSTPFFNEYGAINDGTAAQSGISYEIFNADSNSSNIVLFGATGVPGGETYGLADDLNNVPGTTDNFPGICTANGCNADAGMALTYNFTLGTGQDAVLTALASTVNPGGFSLETIHPVDADNTTSSEAYLTGSYSIQIASGPPAPPPPPPPPPSSGVPEPSTSVLAWMAIGLLAVVNVRRNRVSN